jgi:MFS family permease
MNRKHLLVIIDIYRMIAVAIIVLFMWTGVFQLWHLFFMSFLVGLGSSIFWPCAAAFLQELIHEDDYLAGNSLLSASYQSGTLIGSAVGGFVVYAWGASTALLLDALTYLISAILIGAAKHRSANYLKRNERMVETFKNGLGYISKNMNIFMYGLSALLADVAIWGCLAVLSIVFSIDILHAGARGFGLIDGAYGVGALLSTFVALWMTGVFPRKRFLITAYFIAGFCAIFLTIIQSLVIAMGLYFVMGLHNNSARIISRTILMENIPNDVIGRVHNFLGIITRIFVISSAILVGWIAETYSVEVALVVTSGFFWISLLGVVITNKFSPKFFTELEEP